MSDVPFPGKPTSATHRPMSAEANAFHPSVPQARVSKWIDDGEDDGQQTDSPGNENENDATPLSHSPSNADMCVEEEPRIARIPRLAKRSLRLDNLTVGTSIDEIAAAVRGGLVLEIYQRLREKAAVVSFVQEADAQAFYDHVRRHDLYIKSKRVDVSWNDFQRACPGQLAWQIRGGATRNFIVRNCDPYQTPEGIKDDLEHIHDLRVASVEFRNRDCYIKTNSIAGSVFARTCMSSRQ